MDCFVLAFIRVGILTGQGGNEQKPNVTIV